MKTPLYLSLILLLFLFSCASKTDFITVDGAQFKLGENRYTYLGTNFWYGLNLGSKGAGGDRERLRRELDRLQAMGVTNLRVVAGSEGPDTEPYRMVPALQTSAGVYNQDVLEGLDYLLHEMKQRDMHAVMCMSNFWNWSGGMGQYLVWAGAADSIPYPPPHPGGDWGRYQSFTAQFYSNPSAVKMLNDHIAFIINRTNSFSSVAYKDDPTIMAWQLCNEPRGIDNIADYRKWIEQTTDMIRSLDPHHLITTGSEGNTSSSYSGTDPEKDHAFKNVDYMTVHLWVQNWGVYDPEKADSTFAPSVAYAMDYLDAHETISRKLNKPMVLEEFGISRDGNSHDASSPTTNRDQYYSRIFESIYDRSQSVNPVVAGSNFWAWGGEGRPREPHSIWRAGDSFVGDPPHEFQGWYSVYDTDASTIEVIKSNAAKFGLTKK